jgi:hypothetical protein
MAAPSEVDDEEDSGIGTEYDSDMVSIASSTYDHNYDGERRSENPDTAITFLGAITCLVMFIRSRTMNQNRID